MRGALHAQGLRRHSRADIEAMGARSIAALAVILGDKPYLMGDRDCAADATAYAFMGTLLCPVFQTGLRAAAESHANVVDSVARMTRQHYLQLA